jgi:hypothetical protein
MTRAQSPPRTAAGARAASQVADPETASEGAEHHLIVVVSVFPSQLLTSEMLRRPLESTQYLSIRYTERLAEAGIEPSVGSRGDAYDNAMAESVIGLYKTEVILRKGPWKNSEDVEFKTLEWVDWFNNRRLLEPIGYMPPVEYEAMYYQQKTAPAIVAGVK